MSKQSLSGKWRRGEGNIISRRPWWTRTIISLMVMLTIVMLISACASNNQAANTGVTPTTAGDIPTATPGGTPTTTATSTTTPGTTPTATAASAATNAPAPTKAPVPTQVSNQAPPPTATPVPTRAPTPTPTPVPTATPTPIPTTSPGNGNGKTVTVWIQVTDSCKQALSGATFTVNGPGISTTTAQTAGGSPVSLSSGVCPILHGSCVSTSTGCTSIALDIPTSGTNTYKITVAKTANPSGTNLSFAICEGGSACPHGPEVATVNISSSGSVSATTLNIYPDGVLNPWGPFSGSQSDPVMFHEFGIGDGSITCDGDHDADDYLTGGRGGHCDSDGPNG